jgi:hypothetical protein
VPEEKLPAALADELDPPPCEPPPPPEECCARTVVEAKRIDATTKLESLMEHLITN